MITTDFLLRQVHQLAQVLAAVLLHKRDRDPEAAQAALAEGLEAATGVVLDDLRRMARPDLLALCEANGAFAPEKAVALAELLAEDAAPASWARAAWLYEAAVAAGGPYPFDVHGRLATLHAGLGGAQGGRG